MDSHKALKSAIGLAARGLRIFPLRPYSKTPAITEWQINATSDVEIIKSWWSHNPQYNLGVCMTDWVGFDVDVKKIGMEALDNYKSAGGVFDTLTVLTPTGGYHFYFSGPDSKTCADVKPGIDIRSHHGYLVGPGSVLDPILAGDEKLTAGEYVITNDLPIAECPKRLIRLLSAPIDRKIDRSAVALSLEGGADSEASISIAKGWLENEAEPSIEGLGGNTNAFRVASQTVVDYALSPRTAFDLMMEVWNPRCIPPWDAEDLGTIVENASRYASGRTGFRTPSLMFGGVTVVPSNTTPPAPEPEGPEWWDVEEFGNAPELEDIPDRPWLIERLFMRGQVTLFGGEGGAGKSAITLAMAAHFAVGKGFGPYELRELGKPMRIAMYNAEDDIAEQGRRLHGVCQKYALDFSEVRKNIKFMDASTFGGPLTFAAHGALPGEIITNERAIEGFCKLVEKHSVDLLTYDPLVNLHTCEENDNREMRLVLEIFTSLASRTGTAISMAHHTGKGSGQKARGDQDAFRGAGAIINRCRIAIIVSNALEDEYRKFGISPKRGRVTRLDDAKANLYMKLEGAVAYMKWDTLALRPRELVGVPMLIDTTSAEKARKQSVAQFLYGYMTSVNAACVSKAEAVRALVSSHPPDEGATETVLAKELEISFAHPVPTSDPGISVVFSMVEGQKHPMFHILGRHKIDVGIFA